VASLFVLSLRVACNDDVGQVASVLATLTALGDDVASRRAKLPFALAAIHANSWELELDARSAETAATVRTSALGRLFARVAELAQSPVPADREDASLVLFVSLSSGCCGEKGFEAFSKQWLTAASAGLAQRNSWEVRGRACASIALLIHGLHAIGKDSHVGREMTAAIASNMTHVTRVMEGGVGDGAGYEAGPSGIRRTVDPLCAAAMAHCLSLWRALLVFSPQVVRSYAHKLTMRCLADLDSPVVELSALCQQCLSLLSYQASLLPPLLAVRPPIL
jgi:hypothetical protein